MRTRRCCIRRAIPGTQWPSPQTRFCAKQGASCCAPLGAHLRAAVDLTGRPERPEFRQKQIDLQCSVADAIAPPGAELRIASVAIRP